MLKLQHFVWLGSLLSLLSSLALTADTHLYQQHNINDVPMIQRLNIIYVAVDQA